MKDDRVILQKDFLIDVTANGHLIEQRRDGIVAAVQDQQQRRNFSLPEVKQLVLLRDDLLTTNK